ncbi:MarR family transcriptional regulator [Paraburkholderia sp. 1N]|uniref:MarR family transcriptional regulator n=1 Tax=Paraburkholderia solitsugae TaxID=2675748 RepID=A0ABX2C1W0_9BURK|nr:MarR family winged helix-turn-helix transcriptional regulator [Paraburkholderia solitsugae]NPT46496.1 MarR family transcriptional regulator [Paraburkholderia solitsugae]
MKRNEDTLPNIDGLCNFVAARQASRYLTAAYDRALSPVGLRITQFSILHKLVRSEPITMGELAGVIAMDRTTLTSNLKPLERDGLIDIVPSKEDRRAKQAIITKTGLATYKRALPLWSDVQSAFEDSYGEFPAVRLRDALREVLESGFEPWAEKFVDADA